MKSVLVLSLSLILAAVSSDASAAEENNEGAAGYIESIETEGAAGGTAQEVDAAEAQVEQFETSGSVTGGVSRKRIGQLEEIVVSARRRDELLEETPISVTAIDAATFEDAQITRFAELQNIVPNLRIGTGRSGLGGSPVIRGVVPTESGNPGAGTYIDGIFLQGSGASIMNVADIQQLEVLRGPQGTLFGKNTLGGAINITTVAPEQELSGSVWVRAGNYETVKTRSTLNVPINIGPLDGKVFTRFSVSTENTGGYTENLVTGDSYNNRDAYWLLGKVRILPVDDLEVTVNANYFRSKSRGAGGRCFVVDDAIASLKEQLDNSNPEFYEKCRATTPYTFGTPLNTFYNGQDYGVWGSMVYNFGSVGIFDDLNAKVLGSWRGRDSRTREDVDLTSDNVVELSDVSIDDFPGEPFSGTAALVEAQVYGEAFDGRVSGVGGFFASWNNSSVGRLVKTQLDPPPPEPQTLSHLGAFTYGPVDQNDSDWAFYGQATWDVLEWMSLTGGLRYTNERRGVTRSNIYPTGDLDNIGTPTCIHEPDQPCAQSGVAAYSSWTPMGSIELLAPEDILGDSPIDHLMGYFTYAKGFSSGGLNAVIGAGVEQGSLVPYAPSMVDNFEVGLKTVALDQRMTLNLSFFFMQYDDMQVTANRSIPCPPGSPEDCVPQNERLIRNAAASTMRGLEAELTVRPIEGLMIMTNIGVLDSRYEEFEDVWALDATTPYDRAGETFNGVPQFTSYFAVQYSLPVNLKQTWLSGWLTPRLDWSYRSKVHNTFPEDSSGRVPGYNLLNARLSYEFMDDRAQIALWGQNLTSSRYFNGGGGTTGFFGYSQRYYAAPVTFGGEISYRFD